jgi:hypothetical protein
MSDTRNYAEEAVKILQGESRMLVELGHLQALAAQMESVLGEHRLLSQLLAVVLLDNGVEQMFIPAEPLADVEQKGLNVTVLKNPPRRPGAAIVALTRRPQITDAAGTPARVM